MISCGSQSIKISKRFSELLKFHEALSKSNLTTLYGITLPKFPSKRRTAGKHLIDPLQVSLRVRELQDYFGTLSKIPIILTLDVFHDMLGIATLSKTDRAVAQFKETLEQCGHLALAKVSTPTHITSSNNSNSNNRGRSLSSSPSLTKKKKSKKKSKKHKKSSLSFSNGEEEEDEEDEDDFYSSDENDHSKIGKSLLEKDFLYSQKFHLLAKSVVNCSSSSGAPPPSSVEQEQLMKQANVAKESDLDGTDSAAAPIPALYFTHKLRFHLNSKFWSGDRTIREAPNGRVWFTMVGPIPSVAVGKNPRLNDYFALVNPTSLASPLMFISISAERSFKIWEAMSDGLVGSLICRFVYEAPPAGSRDTICYVMESESGNRQNITCSGVSARKCTFCQDLKNVCATVEEDRENDLVVEVLPHRDVLFYLISTIAIQKLEDDVLYGK